MKHSMKIIISVFILVIMIGIFYFTIKAITGNIVYDNIDEFAQCLSSKGVKMYGAFWCGHCQNEKSKFGESWKYIDYVECDPRGENSEADLCLQKSIEGYPTWEVDGKLYPGEQSFEKLAELSGCKLN